VPFFYSKKHPHTQKHFYTSHDVCMGMNAELTSFAVYFLANKSSHGFALKH